MSAMTETTLEELKADPALAFMRGQGQPVAVMDGEVVLYYLVSGAYLANAETGFSLREAAAHVGSSKSTISRYVQSGKLKARKTSDGYSIDPKELEAVFGIER